MIIGYIAAIALTYVGVWILNAGFDQAIGFVQVIQKQSLNTLDAQSTVWKAVGGEAIIQIGVVFMLISSPY